MNLTNFLIMDGDGNEIEADAADDYIAFNCFNCAHPLLATALENHCGSDEEHPAKCKSCTSRFFLDIRPQVEKLYIHELL